LPEHLLERLILMCTDEGDIVLDPFVGTGTTAVAAKRLGRHFIAIDIDPKYVEMTQRKLEKVYPTKIGDCYVSIFLGQVVTIRDKDWEKLRPYFRIPEDLQRQETVLQDDKLSEVPRLPFDEEEVHIEW
jgi:site-specific DNA-methyltransferase (adenine-specific)